jgi:CheY-like chemotaxis protein
VFDLLIHSNFYAMKKAGPIIVIEDDMEDREMLEETFSILKYPNQVIFFSDGNKAIEHISKSIEKPVLIISDINMPVVDGFEVRKRILKNEALSGHSIPFVFLTTGGNVKAVNDAFAISCGGFFKKGNTMEELRETLRLIIEYWRASYTPSQSVAA